MNSGEINVTAENIFPIIKKFLYSDQEIFLRELVSNAVDATQKLKTLASLGEFKEELGTMKVEVSVDKENNKMTISDSGIGMTSEELDKYINQIAFSSAEEFLEKYQDQSNANPIIGKFGLGFYSAFLVADKVEIITRSYKVDKKSKAVKWECEGNPEYKITNAIRSSRGTDVILHISDDAKEFLEESRIKDLLNKYCKFLPIPIQFGTTEKTEKNEAGKEVKVLEDRIINNTSPAWIIPPSELKDQDYTKFYKEIYPYSSEPLFWIHLNVDYPFNLKGILYFPKISKNFQIQRDRIKLYCNQVYVTDQLEDVVPNWLIMLEGVIDSPDIPLNVSRSFLQKDGNVKKIGNYITKKIAEKLEKRFKKDREAYEKLWNDIKMVIQYGMIWDEKFLEKAKGFYLLKNIDGKHFTFDEYLERIQTLQTDKNDKLIYLYTTNVEEQHSFIQPAKEKGFDILIMEEDIDLHFIDKMEKVLEKVSFVRVDADTIDKLIDSGIEKNTVLTEKEQDKLKSLIEDHVDKQRFTVKLDNMGAEEFPMVITKPEFNRRMQNLSGLQITPMQGVGGFGSLNQLVVNENHFLIQKILKSRSKNKQKRYIKHCIDLALLSQNMLKGADLTDFVKRSVSLFDA